MGDPLRFDPVTPMQKPDSSPPASHEDQRPFWQRMLLSLRPSVGTDGTDKKTGKTVETASITGHADF